MFQLHATKATSGALQGNPFLKRAAFFGGALLLLLLAFQLLPSAEPDPSELYSDASGTVATKMKTEARPQRDSGGFKPGYLITILLLASGGAFALYLKRNGAPGVPVQTPIRHVSAFQVAPGQQLRLVSFNGEVLLLGVTSSQITLLKSYAADELAAPEPVSAPALQEPVPARPPAPPASFASLLQQFSGAPASRPASDNGRWPA